MSRTHGVEGPVGSPGSGNRDTPAKRSGFSPRRRLVLGLSLAMIAALVLVVWLACPRHMVRNMTAKEAEATVKAYLQEKPAEAWDRDYPHLPLFGHEILDLFGKPHEEAIGPPLGGPRINTYYWRYRCSDGWLIISFEGVSTVEAAKRKRVGSYTAAD